MGWVESWEITVVFPAFTSWHMLGQTGKAAESWRWPSQGFCCPKLIPNQKLWSKDWGMVRNVPGVEQSCSKPLIFTCMRPVSIGVETKRHLEKSQRIGSCSGLKYRVKVTQIWVWNPLMESYLKQACTLDKLYNLRNRGFPIGKRELQP